MSNGRIIVRIHDEPAPRPVPRPTVRTAEPQGPLPTALEYDLRDLRNAGRDFAAVCENAAARMAAFAAAWNAVRAAR